jgi:hypothetical protein
MNRLITIGIVCWVLGSNWSLAEDPVDNQVKNALADITRFETQFSGKSSVSASQVKRTLRLLTLTRQRLDKSTNQSHTSWKAADARYIKLVTQLNQFLAPKNTANQTTKTTPPSSPAAPSPALARPPQQMISQYRVRIKKITRDIQSRTDTLDKAGIKPFQDPTYVKSVQQSAQSFKKSLAKYDNFKQDPDVLKAAEALTKLEQMIGFGQKHAAKELKELGDIQSRLRTINQKIRQLRVPPTPQEPYQKGQLGQWLTQLATLRQNARKIHAPLPAIKQRAYLPDQRLTVEQGGIYDLKDADRLERSLITTVNTINNQLKTFGEQLNLIVAGVKADLPHYTQYDPANRNDQANHFLSVDRADEIRARLAQHQLTISEAAHYAQLLKDSTHQERLAILKEAQTATGAYEANYQKARQLVRLPKAASTDPNLTAIAKKTLANYEDVGDIKRLVINTKKVHRSKETSETKYDDVDVSLSGTVTLSGTKTTYSYEWDQFQVATAEPVSDKHYIYYNTLKYFTSGSTTTPLNRWILSGRIQSCEIPVENINKE